MSTLPDDSQAPKREPASLWLRINGAYYRVERVILEDRLSIAWRLIHFEDKAGHGPYLIVKDGPKTTCECGSFVMQREKRGECCKHISSCQAVGLL